MHKRCIEHMEAIKRGDGSSGMSMHMKEAHPGIDLRTVEAIEMTLVQQRHKNMERGIAEAVLMECIEKDGRYSSTH